MARPTKTDDPRRTILAAARKLVVKHGHRQLSLRAVAAEAGFSPASLYEYFDGKAELVSALAARAQALLLDRLRRAAGGRAPAAALVEVGLAYVAFAREHREDFLLLFTGLESRRSGLLQAVPIDSPYELLAVTVRAALARQGRNHPSEVVDGAAYALWAAAHGMAMLQLTHLARFSADFPTADRKALLALVKGLHLDGR